MSVAEMTEHPLPHADGPAASSVATSDGAQTAQRLEDMERVTDSALAYLSLEDMLSELLDRVRSGLSADTAAVRLLDEDREVLVARAAKGIEEEVRQGVQIPLGRGFAGRVAAERRPIILERVSKPDIVNPILEQRGIRSLLGVPLLVEGRSEEHTSELQSQSNIVCRLLLEKKKKSGSTTNASDGSGEWRGGLGICRVAGR